MAENWPDWRISSENAGELARYVDTSYTRNWVPADARGPWPGPGEGRRRAERLYEELRAHKIGYAHEPWNPRRRREGEEFLYQRIRGPEETMQGPATCLDLALVYAGMALCAGLRPLIGLRTGQDPHALLLLDVRSAVSDLTADERKAPPLSTARPGDPGVWDVRAPADLLQWGETEGWLLVDVARAARRGDADSARFSGASGRGLAGELAEAPGDHQWTLVDVDAVAARSDHVPYSPPAGLAVPPIHGYLPAIPAFHEYGTRQKLLARLLGLVDAAEPSEPAVLVLQAPQGFGKSMLAHRLAVAADHGCGWFLTAPDVKSLTASLAMAERQEKELRGGPAAARATGEKPDPGEDRALASAALDRLRHAERPWVVVLDNCDVNPASPGLGELLPVPHSPGQLVIITTIDERWEDHARSRAWIFERLRPLDPSDLDGLGLPPGFSDLVNGRPLIAQALAALQEAGAGLPDQADCGGPELVWDLVRTLAGSGPEVAAVARILAWCPPEPADATRLLTAAGYPAGAQAPEALAACHTLDQRRFVTLSFPDTGMAVQMHRLFAAAVRSQTWRDDPGLAADVIGRLLTAEAGQELFIGAAEETALSRLERGPGGEDDPGEVARAAGYLAEPARRGLLWHGLGRVRERRGPVARSAPHFTAAAGLLGRASHPAEAAESLVGPARVVYQKGAATPAELIQAREIAAEARQLAGSLTDPAGMQLSEQANALVWLITQKLAQRESDPAARAAALGEVRENLWQSYERRRRILRREGRPEPGSSPAPEDGLGSERAFFNLAGVNIQLAKVHHTMANASGGRRDAALAEVAEDLDQAARVYEVVRELRERRYAGRAHPHLAACVQGQALVAYFRATLLGDVGQFPAAFGFAATALEQRRKVAGGLAGSEVRVLRDNDVNKSIEFMFKLSYTAMVARADDAGRCAATVRRLLAEVPGEFDGPLPMVTIGSGD